MMVVEKKVRHQVITALFKGNMNVCKRNEKLMYSYLE